MYQPVDHLSRPTVSRLNKKYKRGEKVLRWPKGVGRGVRLMSLRLDQRGADACPTVLLRLRLRLLFLLYRRGRHPLPLKVESRAVWLEQSLEKLDLARTRTLSGGLWRAVESGLNSALMRARGTWSVRLQRFRASSSPYGKRKMFFS